MKEQRLILSFKGNKAELKQQFKILVAKNNTNMNARILTLIEKDLKEAGNLKS